MKNLFRTLRTAGTLFSLIFFMITVLAQSDRLTVWSVQEGPNTDHRAAIAYSPDGKLVAAGCSNSNTVEIRDADSGKLLRNLSGQNNNANVIAFSPNGLYLATGTGESGQGLSLNLWRVSDGERLVGRIPAFTNGTISLSFSPDSELLIASGFHANAYNVYHVPDMTLVTTVDNFDPVLGNHVRVNAVAYSPDGHIVAVADTIGIRLRNAADGSLIRTINANAPNIMTTQSLAFSPDGQSIAGGVTTLDGTYATCIDCTIKMFSVADGSLQHTFTLATGSEYQKIGFSPDGRIIGAGFADDGSIYGGSAAFWQVSTERLMRRDQRDFWVEAFAFSPNGGRYAFFGADGEVGVKRAPALRFGQ